jgi:hypothetical protein
MHKNYWQEYLENYNNFMAMYLRELQNSDPNQDIAKEYLDVANFLAPPMQFEDEFDFDPDEFSFAQQQVPQQQAPGTFISPGGGLFTLQNCRRMPIVNITMRRGFTPSRFYLVVSRFDLRSISGHRIECDSSGNIRFRAITVELRNINVMECAF